MSKKNVAVIGAGRWGKNLVRNFYQLGALHTVCDTNKILLKGIQENYPEVQLTSNIQEMLENPAVTRVVIAAPAIQHYKLAKLSILAGKDVYVEKPLCMNVAEGEELIELARQHGRILMVGHLLQYHPCVLKLQELINFGLLGKLHYISSHRLNLG